MVIAWRYLRGRGSRLLHRTAVAAVGSTTVGIAAMVVAMSLMSGYRYDLERKLVGGNAAVLVYPLDPRHAPLTSGILHRLEEIPGVRKVGRVAYGQGTLAPEGGGEGVEVTLRGVEPGGPGTLSARSVELTPDRQGVPGVVLGEELARRLGLRSGDLATLVALGFDRGRPRFHYRSVRVTGTFRSGFAEFDRSWVVLARALLDRLGGLQGGGHLYEVAVDDPLEAPSIAERAEDILGPDFWVTHWQQMNQPLFSALRLQQLGLFFLLGLIVLVSTFNVASTLMVLVRERLQELGVLRSLGLATRSVASIFLVYGLAVGAGGVLLGMGTGIGVSWLCDRFHLIRFDPELAAIYFISSVPFRIRGVDLLAIVTFAGVTTLASCLFPAWRAARMDPGEALRYQ